MYIRKCAMFLFTHLFPRYRGIVYYILAITDFPDGRNHVVSVPFLQIVNL